MQRRRTAVVSLLLLACGGQTALAPMPRPRIGRPRCAAVSAHAPAPRQVSKAAAASGQDTGFLRREVVRPIFMHVLIYWNGLRRHMRGRAQLARSSFDGEAARITWVGAAVNVMLTGFKLVAGVVGHSSAMLADAGHSLSDLLTDAVTLVTLRLVRPSHSRPTMPDILALPKWSPSPPPPSPPVSSRQRCSRHPRRTSAAAALPTARPSPATLAYPAEASLPVS